MGMKERRDMEKSEMKRKIIQAAVEIIEQEGYEKLSIRKIAAKIEYSPTTLYLYYKDKAEIIADMSNGLYSKIYDAAVSVINKGAICSKDKQVHEIMRLFLKVLCGEPEMAKAIMYSGLNVIFENDSADRTPVNPGIDLLDHLISDGIAQGVFRADAEHTSWMLVSALLGFAMSAIANQLYLQDNFDRLAEAFIKILMEGIKQ